MVDRCSVDVVGDGVRWLAMLCGCSMAVMESGIVQVVGDIFGVVLNAGCVNGPSVVRRSGVSVAVVVDVGALFVCSGSVRMNRSIKLRAIGVHQPGCEGVLPSGVTQAMMDAVAMCRCDGGVMMGVLWMFVFSMSITQSFDVVDGVVLRNVVMVVGVL